MQYITDINLAWTDGSMINCQRQLRHEWHDMYPQFISISENGILLAAVYTAQAYFNNVQQRSCSSSPYIFCLV